MRYQDVIAIACTMWVVMFFTEDRGHAAGKPTLTFGKFKGQYTNQQQRERFSGRPFSAEDAIILPMESRSFILYDDHVHETSLSVVEHKQEHVLKIIEDIRYMRSALVPRPILAAGRLDANSIPDLLFCYSVDRGVSNYVEHYDQYLLFFLDGHQEVSPKILLSASDWDRGDDGAGPSDGKGNPASIRESLVMLIPASEQEDLTVHVWSRVEIFAHSPTNTPDSKTFHIDRYRIRGQSAQLIDHVEGTHQATYTQLRSLIEERQQHGDTPLLLAPSHTRTSLETVKEWFDWWGKPRSVEDEE